MGLYMININKIDCFILAEYMNWYQKILKKLMEVKYARIN